MSDDSSHLRRTVLKAAGGLVGGAVVGFGLFANATDPAVGQESVNGRLLRDTQFQFVVYNRGARGHVLVSAKVLNSDVPERVLNSVSEEIHMNKNEGRIMTLSMNVPEGAEDFEISATPTDFPGNIFY